MMDVQDDIILKFKEGDRNAFDAIYLQLRKPIIRFCKYMVPVDDAQDITADIFVKLWKTREQWDNIKNVKAFLYMSARNACLDFLKSQKTRSEKKKEIAQIIEREEQYILQSQIEAELVAMIRKEIEQLPETSRTVFSMAYLEGYSNAEIAQKLNLADKTIRNLKSIALDTIRKNLANKGFQVSSVLILIQLIKRLP